MSALFLYQDDVLKQIISFKEFIKNNFMMSLLILTGAHIIGSLLVIPGAMFEFACGLIFGTFFIDNLIGYILSIIAYLTIGAIAGVITFNFSKCLLKNILRKYFIEPNQKMRKFDEILNFYGTKALFLLRLSPLLPVSMYNYLLGGFNGI
jgi:uncharacterized membrane protein YdjX (TVP38/TMEM64 family)